jgi:hypothetical protein
MCIGPCIVVITEEQERVLQLFMMCIRRNVSELLVLQP